MRHEPQDVVVDGRPLVAVPAKDLESLLAMRRQLGSQTARMRALRDTLFDTVEFLEQLAEVLAGEREPAPHEPHAELGAGHAELVAGIRQRARDLRAVTGAGRAAKDRRGRPARHT
ncbi:hypothetical protein [Streptomyces sp. NPDC093018]|uniref:hypothetical protein n=1 Tax=Streptomyces sp. NPDC093018 TaxID=3155067 RepID=UPI00342C96CF